MRDTPILLQNFITLLTRQLLKKSIVVILLAASFAATGQTKYIKQYRPLADSLSGVYGIPAAVILGVAIVESSAGTGRNSKLLNNHFGIIGKNNLHRTKKIKTRYKQYPNAKASYIDFCKVIANKKFYQKLKGNLKYSLWLNSISKTGYSEVPSVWIQRVSSTIKKYKLSSTP